MKWILPLAIAILASQPLFAEAILGVALTKVPITISKAGTYYLTKDLNFAGATGSAITVNAASVVIDLNGHALSSTSTSANTAVGISSTANRVTVEDGTVAGFARGVVLDTEILVVKDLLVNRCLHYGIVVNGNRIEISRNRVCETGGATSPGVVDAAGIVVTGTYATILYNDVQDTFATDSSGHTAEGILIKNSAHIVASDNRVLDVEPSAPTNGGGSTGITISASTNLILTGNIAETDQVGFDLTGGTIGDYGDNITSNPSTSYSTAGSTLTDIGNNQ